MFFLTVMHNSEVKDDERIIFCNQNEVYCQGRCLIGGGAAWCIVIVYWSVMYCSLVIVLVSSMLLKSIELPA